jgi:hypothetical protein
MRARVSTDFYRKVLGRPEFNHLTPEEHARLVEAFGTPEMRQMRWNLTGNPDTVVAEARVAELKSVLREGPTTTDFHFYYATTNVIDRQFAATFQDCPTATLHPITPLPKDWSQDVFFRDPDHAVASILQEMGQLSSLFSAYL